MRKKKALMNDYCGDKIIAIAEPLNKVAEGYIAVVVVVVVVVGGIQG